MSARTSAAAFRPGDSGALAEGSAAEAGPIAPDRIAGAAARRPVRRRPATPEGADAEAALHLTRPWRLAGMWLAFGTSAILIALFVTGVTRTLARLERELGALRALAARNERLASLTALAAGAAHELATPLASIAVAAREMERAAARRDTSSLGDDASLIRSQVDRCRDILDRMSGRAGAKWVEAPRPVAIGEVLDLLLAELGADARVRLRVDAEREPVLVVPGAGLVQVLRNLVGNALDASAPGQTISLTVRADAATVAFSVRDRGRGMPRETLERIGEPFFTTKPAGAGYGLGLFVVRLFAERHGGTLSIDSVPARGTAVVVTLPREARRCPRS